MTKKPSLIRTIIFYFLFFLTIPITAIAMFTASFFSLNLAFSLCKLWGKGVNLYLKYIGGVNIETEGALPETNKPFLIIANHTGPWETVAFMPYIKGNLTYVLKKQLLSWKYNFFALGLSSINPIAINRESNAGDFKIMQEGLEKHFALGNSVIIFPGGTREELVKSVEFSPGGVLLAKKAGVPVLPVYINSEAWARGKIIKDYGMVHQKKIRIVFGELISKDEIAEKKAKEIHIKIQDFMKQNAEIDLKNN